MSGVDLEDIIASNEGGPNKTSLIEALLSTVDAIFTNNRMLQRSRLSQRHIRGVERVVGSQTFLRARFTKSYKPFINPDTGEFTQEKYDNRVLTAITEAMLAGRISLDGKSRDEIIRIFQAVGNSAETPETGGSSRLLGRFDY